MNRWESPCGAASGHGTAGALGRAVLTRSRAPRPLLPAWLGLATGVLWLSLALAHPAQAYEHRRGTPSIGVQFQLGFLGYDSEWADIFQPGRGVAIRAKQYVARNQALGFSFEQQKFNESTTVPLTDPAWQPDFLQMQILMVDYYRYFMRQKRRTPYLIASVGFYRPEIVDEGAEDDFVPEPGQTVEHPKEGVLARLGVGLEYFIVRAISVDGTLSGYYINTPSQDGLTVSGMFALGIHIYTGK